jgi:hypothetical protein
MDGSMIDSLVGRPINVDSIHCVVDREPDESVGRLAIAAYTQAHPNPPPIPKTATHPTPSPRAPGSSPVGATKTPPPSTASPSHHTDPAAPPPAPPRL